MSEHEIDPHTGRRTTGHEWNGLKELETPIPKLVWGFYIATTIVAIVMWILLPTWPTGNNFTPGVLGVDQAKSLNESLEVSGTQRSGIDSRIIEADFTQMRTDPEISAFVDQHGERLFVDNCAGCHGVDAKGGFGFPNLTDDRWLWGGEPEDIMETLRVGVNTKHEDARISQMMAFGTTKMLSGAEINDVVAYVLSLQEGEPHETPGHATSLERGEEIFKGQCATCHGVDGKGSREVGAPNLTDTYWLYGGTARDLEATIYYGRQGVMPYWSQRLPETDRKVITAYLKRMSESDK